MLKKVFITSSLVIMYLALWYGAAMFEYAPFASLWYAPAGLTVAILLLWKRDGFLKVWLCVWAVSVLTQYSYFDNPGVLRVLLVSTSAAFTHTIPYWIAVRAFSRAQPVLQSTSTGDLLRPILYPVYLLAGSLGAALLGILSQVTFAEMPVSVAKSIWLGWWIGDYVGVIVLAPLFLLIGCRFFGRSIEPGNSFLLSHSNSKEFLPRGALSWVSWVSIISLPSIVTVFRVEVDEQVPVVLAFLLALLPIAILATRNTWGVLVTATVLSSVSIIVTVKYFGVLGDAITYQATLLAITVTSLYLYDLVRSFDSGARQLLDAEISLSTASKLLTLNEVSTNIAHEINTPLQAALSSTQRVRRRLAKLDGEWSVELAELNNTKAAIEQAGKTVDIVRNLVKVSEADNVHCRISDALLVVCKFTEAMIRKQNIRIDIQGTSNLPLVIIEQNELAQIFLNLLSNSISSLNNELVREIYISAALNDDVTVYVEFSDTGKGVEVAISDKLFRLGNTEAKDGLGLGLWVSKSIAERRGGTLEYFHGDGGKWCFRLTLKCSGSSAL